MKQLVINGIKVDAATLMGMFLMIFDPDEEKWYRFVKQSDQIMIQVASEDKAEAIQ